MFDAQRTAVKQSRQAAKQSLAFQRNAGKMTASVLRGQESAQRQGLELFQAAMQGSIDATGAMSDVQSEPDQRRTIDQAFAQLKETHSEIFGVLEREVDRSVDSFDDLSQEYVEALEEGTDQLLESHRTIEDETVRNAEELSTDLLEGLERSQAMLDQLEDQFERQTERTEQLFERQVEGAEEYQQRLEEEADQMQHNLRQPALEAGTHGSHTPGEPERLETVDGLSETVQDRLAGAGITSVDELAASDPETVSEAAEVSEERAENWIDQAQD